MLLLINVVLRSSFIFSPHYTVGADLGDYMPPAKPRTLPVPVKLEVAVYSKKEGVARQLELLNSQDRWQNNLVKSQHYITEQKSLYLDKRAEMFDKVSARVEARLEAFVEDIKYMQKSVKKELGESNSTERDLRRLFEESHGNVIQAEKLSFVLESLEKFKVTINNRYESAFKQVRCVHFVAKMFFIFVLYFVFRLRSSPRTGSSFARNWARWATSTTRA